jgi:hypothetical protein
VIPPVAQWNQKLVATWSLDSSGPLSFLPSSPKDFDIMIRKTLFVLSACVVPLLVAPLRAHADIVMNGSLEDLNGAFVNTAQNYMALGAGSTTIAHWTVASTTMNDVAWGKSPTGDHYNAADGTFFVDLTGFGSASPNGAIQQQLNNLIIGQTYLFSMDSFVNGALPSVTVGLQQVALSAGTPFTIGTTTWTPETGRFVAAETNPLLTIANTLSGQDIDFVDNINITSAVPEPSSALLVLAIGGILLAMRCGSRVVRPVSKLLTCIRRP